MIEEDQQRGLQPFAVVSAAGTVNTGAIDDLQRVGQICADKNLWHHVDGAFGALIALSPVLRERLAEILVEEDYELPERVFEVAQ